MIPCLGHTNGSLGIIDTLPETNIFAPENRPKPNRKVVFQPSIFRGKVAVQGGKKLHKP